MNPRKHALALAVVLSLTACGEKQTVETYLAQAEQLEKENKFKESEIAFKNAVQLAPNDANLRVKFGQFYLSRGENLGAIKELEKGQSLKYEGRGLISSLARAYLVSDQNDSVLELGEAAEKLTLEEKVEYFSYQTLALIRSNELDKARELVKRINDMLPANAHAILANAYVALAEQKMDKASTLVEKSLSVLADNPEAVMLQGQIFAGQSDYESAAKSFKHYQKLQPQSKLIYLLLADTLVKTDDYLEAEQYADAILSAVPNQPVALYVKAVVRFAEKDYKLAQEVAEKGLQNGYMVPHLRLVAGASAFYQANYEQANHHLGSILHQLTPEHAARKMYAVSQFHLGSIENIAAALENYQPVTEADQEFMSSLSFNLLSVGATEQAKQLVGQTPTIDSPLAASRQGVLKLLMSDLSGVEDIEKAVRENPELIGAELALSYVALEQGDTEKALSIAKNWQEKNPEKADGYNMAAAVYIRLKNLDAAKKELEKSLEVVPDNIFAMTELSAVFNAQGDKEKASTLAKQAVEKHPNHVKALRIHYALEKSEQALGLIKAAFEQAENKNTYAVLYMEALADQKKLKDLLAVADQLTLNMQTPKKVWQLQLFAHQRMQKGDLIRQTLEKWNDVNPYHIEPVMLLADYFVKTRQIDRALTSLNKAINGVHSDNTELKLVKMQLLLDSGKVDEAKRLFADIDKTQINDSITTGIIGRIAFLEKDFAKAVKHLGEYYQSFSSSQNAVLYALALQEASTMTKAVEFLEEHIEKNAKDVRAKDLLASMYAQVDQSKALVSYRDIVKSQPLNVVALNNLAWLAMEDNSLEEALTHAEKAYELAPKVPNVVDTYAQVLSKLDRKREALNKSKEAYDLVNGRDIDIKLHYIEILLLNSRTNEAKALLLDVKPQTEKQKSKISELLNKI
ncbi:XrtA/PEP-CTERM system TPR-repeat protein PrsT [Thalassotalea marina]|uniref:PEP-CTERM system TPR-repeat protein PrsT n=1 Tax=Thalassotalea marina TaxID=1673741 RepID=A0A919EMI4_9GAMM|nr:XrtA/PEP-CTERM system TPR-repeat protein PrsT [Thalassotalea marina]GHF99191.1 hypothetical protein GCM10017161_29470 [Thalassotalea marina]